MTRRVECIVLVGPGRAGTSLARLWQRCGHEVVGVVGGSAASLAAAQAVLGAGAVAISARAASAAGSLLLIATPDAALDAAVASLAAGHPGAIAPANAALAIHVLGARGRDALAPLADIGLHVAAFHPLQPFPTRDPGSGDLGGASCAIEADTPADAERLFTLARDIGGVPFRLAAPARALYHAAAALIGNGTLALFDVAERALVSAGIAPAAARPALLALARGALTNAAAVGAATALTGPAVRGDRPTIVAHLDALAQWSPSDRELYAAVTAALIRLAATRADGARAAGLADLVSGNPP